MHWIYVIECENNIIYVGETYRLFSRLKEHCKKHTGSVTTHSVDPKKLIGLFRLENINKKQALDFENLVTEMIMTIQRVDIVMKKMIYLYLYNSAQRLISCAIIP